MRPDAAATVTALRGFTGVEPLLVTGDNAGSARALAAEAGVREVRAGLLPQDKVDAVTELQRVGHRVAVIGDRVNDAPALATADVGVAMGGIGSDPALRGADVVVVRADLAAPPAAVALARRARRLVVQDLVDAGTVITALMLWDLLVRGRSHWGWPGTRARRSWSPQRPAAATPVRLAGHGPATLIPRTF